MSQDWADGDPTLKRLTAREWENVEVATLRWELEQPDIEVGWSLPQYKRLVGPWVSLGEGDEYHSVNGYLFDWKEG